MQNISIPTTKIFDTVELTVTRPVSPLGKLFSMYPSVKPEQLHFHDFFEIGYCESGSGLFIIDGKIAPFCGKTCSIIYPGQAHIAESSEENGSLWHFLYINVEKLFDGVGGPPIGGLRATNYNDNTFSNVFSYAQHPDLFEVIKQIILETTEEKELYRQALTGLVYALLIKHSRLMKPSQNQSERRYLAGELNDALNFINMNYMFDVSINQLTSVCNMSKPTLQRKMKQFLNMSPMEYVHNLRLNKAALLLGTHKTVIEIATEVGYNTISCFNRKFSAHFNCSPTAYRKNKN